MKNTYLYDLASSDHDSFKKMDEIIHIMDKYDQQSFNEYGIHGRMLSIRSGKQSSEIKEIKDLMQILQSNGFLKAEGKLSTSYRLTGVAKEYIKEKANANKDPETFDIDK